MSRWSAPCAGAPPSHSPELGPSRFCLVLIGTAVTAEVSPNDETRFPVGIRVLRALAFAVVRPAAGFRPVASRAFAGNEVGRLVLKVQVRKVH